MMKKWKIGISSRPIDCKTLFEYGFNNYFFTTIEKQGTVKKTITIPNASLESRKLDLATETDVNAFTPVGDNIGEVLPNIIINTDISAPISKGDVVGKIIYSVDGTDYSTNLVATNSVSSNNLGDLLLKLLLIILVIILFSIFFRKTKNKKKSKKSKIVKRNRNNNKTMNIRNLDIDFYPNYK